MSPKLSKGTLPYGWIVKTSKHYPDRVYYFNINTGASVWDCPELVPPKTESGEVDQDKKVVMEHVKKNHSRVYNNKLNDDDAQNSVISSKFCTPPTAVVVPVVHKQKVVNSVLDSQKKKPSKRKQSTLVENDLSIEPTFSRLNEEKLKKRKRVSPLNKSNSGENDICGHKDAEKSPSPGTLEEQSTEVSNPGPSSANENDVEMQDVSMDLIDDLTEKKETVFDTTACYYIVVDTNVLIRELHLISELKDTPLDGCGPPHIFIPWVVIEELDKLKSQVQKRKDQRNSKGCFQRSGASEAIRYLNSVLGKHPRFHGQSPAEAEEWAKTYSKCNDDKILECCMALGDKMPAEKVILLTNDRNLVNKALICKINVHNFESMMKKVKPDTVFNYEDMKCKKKKKEKECEESKSSVVSPDVAQERLLQSKRDICKCEIHTIMANARLLLKVVLSKFLNEEMQEAYGDLWKEFPIEKKLLKGILEGIKKYWRAVFSLFLSEKDKRNFELLLEKSSRPEGFLGDKDECLVILSAIEDVFRQIQKHRPNLKIPVEQIQDYRVACVNSFITYCETESSIRTAEEKTICAILDRNWVAINQLCGIILDYYKIPHSFNYEKISRPMSEMEIRCIMVDFYPGVQKFKNLLCSIRDAIKDCKPVKVLIKKLATHLLSFIPSLKLPCDPVTYPFFNQKALERFFTCPQNRHRLEVGVKQIEKFYSKLDEALRVILLPGLRDKSPVSETMICD